MKAVVFHRAGHVEVNEIPHPKIEHPGDIVLRVTSTAICGSDLHIYNGFIPQKRQMVLGHEFMGVVEEVGDQVSKLQRGDRVVVPFPIACGKCSFCGDGLPGHCERSNPEKYGPEGGLVDQKGGGLFGYTDLYGGYDGGQAEYVRVPYANFGPRKIDERYQDEEVLFLTDIFPTGWSAIDWANLKGGETVAVFGCGPVGLMAQKIAWLRGAGRVIGVDRLPYRLEMAKRAANSETINFEEDNAIERIRIDTFISGYKVGLEANRNLTDKLANVVHRQAGSIAALELCISAVRRGGVVSVVGVYGMPYDAFPVGQIFDKGIRMAFGQAPVQKYIDELIGILDRAEIKLHDIITHRLPLEQAPNAYKMFRDKEDNCVKVVLKP